MQSTKIVFAAALVLALAGCSNEAAPDQPVEESVEPIPAQTTEPAETGAPVTTRFTLDEAIDQCVAYADPEHEYNSDKAEFADYWGGTIEVHADDVTVHVGKRDGEYYLDFANHAQPGHSVWCRTDGGNIGILNETEIAYYYKYFV